MKCHRRYCKREADGGMASCAECRAKAREYYHRPEAKARKKAEQQEQERLLRENGVCRECRVNETHFESPRCRPCLDRAAAYRRQQRVNRMDDIKAGKRCTCCTNRPPARGRKMCMRCLTYQRAWHHSYLKEVHDADSRIIEQLMDGQMTLKELSEAIGMSTRNTLRNLQRMAESGTVTRVFVEDTDGPPQCVYILKRLEVSACG